MKGAKGAGGVSGRGATASGTNLKTADLDTFVAEVKKTAKQFENHRGEALIARVYSSMSDRGLTVDQFKSRLVDAFKADKIDLARNELHGALPKDEKWLPHSEVSYAGGLQKFYYVRLRQ